MSVRSTIVLLGALLSACVAAKDQYIFKPTTAAPSATALPGACGYKYVGCWNETVGLHGGLRALAGGKDSSHDGMTTTACLEYCATGHNGKAMQYAGLEFGRECWCGSSLSALSEKLDDSSRCIYSCGGNASEICGGQLALTLYNLTVLESKTGIATAIAWSQFSGAAGYGTLAIITLIIAAVL